MWLRVLLLLVFWFLLFRLVFRVFREIAGPAVRRGKDARPENAGDPNPRARSPWRPADVIDVPFREARDEPAGAGADGAARAVSTGDVAPGMDSAPAADSAPVMGGAPAKDSAPAAAAATGEAARGDRRAEEPPS